MRLTDKKYWDEDYRNLKFSKQGKEHSINIFLNKHLKPCSECTCLEMGSYPGPFLASIGDLGYELNGIDYNSDNDKGLKKWLQESGYKCGNFWVADIFSFNVKKKFDVVCSFGLIEHFTNFEDVILKHVEYVKPGGILIITTPNFRGFFQYLFHRILDYDNLKAHHLPSMRPQKWASLLKRQGFTVEYKGYFGNFGFWIKHPKNPGFAHKFCYKVVSYLAAFTRKFIPFESVAYSAFCGIVAKKQ